MAARAVRERVADWRRTVYAGLHECHLTEQLRRAKACRLAGSRGAEFARAWDEPPSTRGARPAIGVAACPRRGPEAWCCSMAAPRVARGAGPALTRHGSLDDARGAVLAFHFRLPGDRHGYATVVTTWGLAC